jgi:hypothetical protein
MAGNHSVRQSWYTSCTGPLLVGVGAGAPLPEHAANAVPAAAAPANFKKLRRDMDADRLTISLSFLNIPSNICPIYPDAYYIPKVHVNRIYWRSIAFPFDNSRTYAVG